MFVEADNVFYHIKAKDFRNHHVGLPAGGYRCSYDAWHGRYIFEVVNVEGDSYVPLHSLVYRDLESELLSFLDPEIALRLAASGTLNKRGALLYGKHGTGKTATVLSFVPLIRERNGVILLQPSANNIKETIDAAREDDASRHVFIFWDEFDSVVDNDEQDVLRFLDGIHSLNNIFTFACLNTLDDISDRIYDRPSRFAVVAEVENPNTENRRIFLTTKYPDLPENIVLQAVQLTEGCSLDHLKEVGIQLTVFRRSIDEVARRIGDRKSVPDDPDSSRRRKRRSRDDD